MGIHIQDLLASISHLKWSHRRHFGGARSDDDLQSLNMTCFAIDKQICNETTKETLLILFQDEHI